MVPTSANHIKSAPKPPIPPRPRKNIYTPIRYSTKDFPSLPVEGWIKPCYYEGCRMATAERFRYNNYRIPCCRTCIKNSNLAEYFSQIFNNE